jgi:uncharacterized membrane protein YheB (UPF0754 family)
MKRVCLFFASILTCLSCECSCYYYGWGQWICDSDSTNNYGNQITALSNGIYNETNERITSDQQISNRIGNLSENQDLQTNAINSKISRLDDKYKEFSRPYLNVDLNLRIFDTKRTSLDIVGSYNVTRMRPATAGLRLSLKLSKSYEQRLIEKLQKEIDLFRASLAVSPQHSEQQPSPPQ